MSIEWSVNNWDNIFEEEHFFKDNYSGSLYKNLKDNSYILSVRDKEHKGYPKSYKGFKSKEEAKKYLATIL